MREMVSYKRMGERTKFEILKRVNEGSYMREMVRNERTEW